MTRDFMSFAVSEDYWYVGHNEIKHWLLRLSLVPELGQLSVLGSHNLVIGMTRFYCSRFCFCFAFFFFFFFLAMSHGLDLNSLTGIKPGPKAVTVSDSNHWPTRDSPVLLDILPFPQCSVPAVITAASRWDFSILFSS